MVRYPEVERNKYNMIILREIQNRFVGMRISKNLRWILLPLYYDLTSVILIQHLFIFKVLRISYMEIADMGANILICYIKEY